MNSIKKEENTLETISKNIIELEIETNQNIGLINWNIEPQNMFRNLREVEMNLLIYIPS